MQGSCNAAVHVPVTGTDDSILLGTGLSKRFREISALADVSIRVARGDAIALLGPNGAGKTTLLRILAGLSRPSSGAVRAGDGRHPRIGWVPHEPAVYRRLTVRENLRLFARLEGADDADGLTESLIERADLGAVADRPAGRLSTGTLQRLNLSVALAGRPAVLLLDEPTATLSAEQVRRLWGWLDELRSDDELAVLFSTQSIDEAVRFADRMVVLNAGRVAFEGTAETLLARFGSPEDAAADAAERAFLRLVGETV